MSVKTIAIVVFDDFTDVDFFLMYDIFGRNQHDWNVKVLGLNKIHRSTLGIEVQTNGHLSEAYSADVVLFISGYKGVPSALKDPEFMSSLQLNPNKQLIGSICAGSFIIHKLGLLDGKKLTTHPDAKPALEELGGEVLDEPLVVEDNIATAGGCLSALYLTGWVIERLFDENKRRETQRQLIPAGQSEIFENIIKNTIVSATMS